MKKDLIIYDFMRKFLDETLELEENKWADVEEIKLDNRMILFKINKNWIKLKNIAYFKG